MFVHVVDEARVLVDVLFGEVELELHRARVTF